MNQYYFSQRFNINCLGKHVILLKILAKSPAQLWNGNYYAFCRSGFIFSDPVIYDVEVDEEEMTEVSLILVVHMG